MMPGTLLQNNSERWEGMHNAGAYMWNNTGHKLIIVKTGWYMWVHYTILSTFYMFETFHNMKPKM